MQKDLCLIKLGGSVITNTAVHKEAKPEVITRLLREIYGASQELGIDVIIGHGGGSFPHIIANKYEVQKGLVKKDSMKGSILTLSDARELNSIFIKCGAEIDMPVFPFSPSSFTLSSKSKISDGFVSQIKEAMELGFIPVVYGDVGIDTIQGVCIISTEEILRFLSGHFKPSKVIFGTDVDGVFNGNPSAAGAKLVTELNHGNIEGIISAVGTTKKVDVTGGMRTKVSLMYEIVDATGATGYIANATKPNVIRNILMGKPETCTVVRK
jgi:isopentenyl phosphate kinase